MTEERSWAATWLTPIVLGVLALMLYLPSLGGEFLNWDDEWLIVENDQMAQPGYVKTAFVATDGTRKALGFEYLPVRDLSFWVDRTLFGLSATAFHRTNVLIYAVSCALVFLLLRAWTRNEIAATAGAVFFLVHPVHVESVAWIAERKGLLALLFLVAALLVYFRWLRDGGWGRFAAFVALYALAGASKSTVHFLPLALPLLVPVAIDDATKRRAGWRRCGLAVVGTLVVAVPLVALNAHFQSLANDGTPYPGGSLGAAIPIMATVFVRYAIQLVVPLGLAADYDLPALEGPLAAAGVASVVLVVGLGLFLVARWWRDRGRLVGAGLFSLVALGPVSNLVPLPNQMADRYLLLPTIGVAVLVGAAFAAAWRWNRRGTLAVGVTIALVFAALSVRQMTFWETKLALWERTTEIAPGKARSWVNLGDAIAASGDATGAIDAYRRAAFAGRDDAFVQLQDDAFVQLQVGQKLHRAGQLDLALVHARRAVDLDPRSVLAHDQLARFLVISGVGEPEEIERLFRRGMELADAGGTAVERAVLRRNLGEFVYRNGRVPEGRALLEESLRYEPEARERASIHRTLALIAAQMNDPESEIENLRNAIVLAPNTTVNARVILAQKLLASRRSEDRLEAIQLLQEAVRIGGPRPADEQAVVAARRMLAQLAGR